MSYEQARTELIQTVERRSRRCRIEIVGFVGAWRALARRCEAWLEGARSRLEEVRTQTHPDQQDPDTNNAG